MSKDDKHEDIQAGSQSQSADRGYVSSDFEKRREFREFINGNTALRERVVESAIKRVEERNKTR